MTSIGNASDTARTSALERRIFWVLAGTALIYAFLAGLRTVSDPDLGWQLATGRWVAQHHRVFSSDVFSYTASGQPWIYPAGSGLLFYWIYLLGGYALLSWFGAIACAATVALLLRRGSAFSAAIAVLAIPLVAERTTPRAEMFTVILFAASLSILWQNYQTGRARLWLLPPLMIAWVNLHLGFVAGLALIAVFAVAELLKLTAPSARSATLERLRRLWPCLLATIIATLVNPWGWNVYQAIVRQNRVMTQHTQLIDEWAASGWSWLRTIPAFTQQPVQHTLAVLLWIALFAAVIATLQRRLFAALLLLAAAYASLRHLRMEALTACIVVVVAGAVLSSAISSGAWLSHTRLRSALATVVAIAVVMFAALRVASFVNGHFYLRSNHLAGFGTGLGWWAPQAAADFVAREHLPGNLFNTYNTGGYLLWQLGPQYPDYIDGRAIPFGLHALPHEQQLLAASLDSPEWQQEADRYHINSMILPLEGYEIPLAQLPSLCSASNWRPVYLDELAIVLLRRTPQTQPLLDRLQINCSTASLPGKPLDHSAASFPRWVNTAYVLLALERNSDALSAADTAMQIFPASARLRAIRGSILYALHRPAAAEQEWLASISLQQDPAVWSELAEYYEQQQRIPEAVHAWQQAVQQATNPALEARSLVRLAHLYIETGHARDALPILDQAANLAPPEILPAAGGRSFRFNVAQARAAAWFSLHDLPRAILFQEEAVQLDPNAGDAWAHLAKLYGRQGRADDQRRAEKRATALALTSDLR